MELVVISVSVLLALLILVFCGLWAQRKARIRFEERFPPISDEEFVALCKPGTNPVVALKVRKIVAEALGVEYDRVHPSAQFAEDFVCQ